MMICRYLSLCSARPISEEINNVHNECLKSTEIIFRSRLNWLLICGPLALLGKSANFDESLCFVLAGLSLVPLAERLSFVTEEVASHTSQTIGALLNATFGNAPELLISSAAMKEGYYRVVQLALLGSILTNLLFVFGLSCLIGGLRFQVQELRITSGNASIGMLMIACAGLALPAALVLSDEMYSHGDKEKKYVDKNFDGVSDINDGPSFSMVGFSRFNAVVMIVGYLLYLLFQLGSHKEEFEDSSEEHDGNGSARKNEFCRRLFFSCRDDENERLAYQRVVRLEPIVEVEMSSSQEAMMGANEIMSDSKSLPPYLREKPGMGITIPQSYSDIEGQRSPSIGSADETVHSSNVSGLNSLRRHASTGSRARVERIRQRSSGYLTQSALSERGGNSNKSHCSDGSEEELYPTNQFDEGEVHMSFRAGIIWLFIITACISAMSDILVDTIDGFAYKLRISEVFTSLVILPYFSNIAEQVSAVIFAYKNEMDLCVGVTVGSAVQIALFVLPGSVLIGWAMDKSMSLYFRGFETCCLIFSVISVAAVLQGGTTNWLVGAYLLGVYFMIGAGFWFHETENLSVDGDLLNLHNHTVEVGSMHL
jgi:Ca2+/H+ antiporter